MPSPSTPVEKLIGRWEGSRSGQPGMGRVERTFEWVMNRRFIHVRNQSVYPQREKNPKGETHEDWGMIRYDRGRQRLVLRQFHIEEFVSQYVAQPGDGPLVFGDDAVTETFELAAPGKAFEVYSESRLKRKR